MKGNAKSKAWQCILKGHDDAVAVVQNELEQQHCNLSICQWLSGCINYFNRGNPNIGFQEWVGLNAVWLFSRNIAMKCKIWWWPRAAIMVIWMLKVQSPAWLLSVSWVRMTQHWHLHEGPRRFDKEQLFMAVIQRPYRGLSLIWQFVGMYKHLTHKFLM